MRSSLVIGLLTCLGCGSPPPMMAPPAAVIGVPINANFKNKVDMLFMVDNSNSMEAMQKILQGNFFEFFKPFDDLAKTGTLVDFHIGVITSDYGAGKSAAPGCGQQPGGQQGRLQARGVKADSSCMPPVGVPFIHYVYLQDGTSASNLPSGQDLPTTFTCMAAVGAAGCGFEQQLESTYAALKDVSGANAGFLRADAALAVVFLTNEDDASAPDDTDIFDKNKGTIYGYEDSYSRQTRWAVECGMPAKQPPYDTSHGKLLNCHGAANFPTGTGPGKQYDIRRYIDFFTKPLAAGGIKANPLDVILYAIDAPETPFEVILSNPGTIAGQPLVECQLLNEESNPPCVPVLQHSCVNADSPELFGDPAVRLNAVVNAATNHKIWSICDGNDGMAMTQLARTVIGQLGAGCLPPEALGTGGTSCTVSDMENQIDMPKETVLPECDGNHFPCWRLEGKVSCSTTSASGLGLTIDRNGMNAPPMTYVRAVCQPKVK